MQTQRHAGTFAELTAAKRKHPSSVGLAPADNPAITLCDARQALALRGLACIPEIRVQNE
jgi:hypothetical protein